MDPSDGSGHSVDLRCRIDRSFGISRAEGKCWMDAARQGDCKTMREMISAKRRATTLDSGDSAQHRSAGPLWRLLHYDGQGTSYGFVGSTALHWAAANGDLLMMKLLLEEGISVNCQNNGGSTALHSAVLNARPKAVELLLAHGANPHVADCCGDTAVQLVSRLSGRDVPVSDIEQISLLMTSHAAIAALADAPPSSWSVAAMKRVCTSLGLPTPVDKEELSNVVCSAIGKARSTFESCRANDAEAASFLEQIRLNKALHDRNVAARSQRDTKDDADDDSGDDDAQEVEALRAKAEEEKRAGNAQFERGMFAEAAKHYTVAISLFSGEAIYYSNRSACYKHLGKYYDALKDAKIAITLQPKWAKAHLRAGDALLALGRHEEALQQLRAADQLSPNDPVVLRAIAEAEAALQRLQSTTKEVAGGKKPWFDCVRCENRTRDKIVTPCCHADLCGTCWRRRPQLLCPFCGAAA